MQKQLNTSFMPDLRNRNRQAEVMDDPLIERERFIGALKGLHRVNIATQTTRLLWPDIVAAAAHHGERQLRVLDVGSGGGDVAVSLWKRAQRAGLNVAIDGCDISPNALTHARDHARRRDADVTFFSHDVLASPLPEGYDVIMCTLFLHHLPRKNAIAFLKNAADKARNRVVIQDLVRGRLGYLTAYWGVRFLLCNDVCRIDGPRSVESAFTRSEGINLMRQAGLEEFEVAKRFPFRMIMRWVRP